MLRDLPCYILTVPSMLRDLPCSILTVPSMLRDLPCYMLTVPSMLRDLPCYLLTVPSMLRDLPCYVPWPLDEHGWEERDLLKLNRSGRFRGGNTHTVKSYRALNRPENLENKLYLCLSAGLAHACCAERCATAQHAGHDPRGSSGMPPHTCTVQ
jgi:hypothetical protein